MKTLINGLVGFCSDHRHMPMFAAGLVNFGMGLNNATQWPFMSIIQLVFAVFAFVCTGWFYSEHKWAVKYHKLQLQHIDLLHVDISKHDNQVVRPETDNNPDSKPD